MEIYYKMKINRAYLIQKKRVIIFFKVNFTSIINQSPEAWDILFLIYKLENGEIFSPGQFSFFLSWIIWSNYKLLSIVWYIISYTLLLDVISCFDVIRYENDLCPNKTYYLFGPYCY